ncbi:MAG: hypothetical protein ACREGJ_02055 [Candidatus Saccharimonadales bacterium]
MNILTYLLAAVVGIFGLTLLLRGLLGLRRQRGDVPRKRARATLCAGAAFLALAIVLVLVRQEDIREAIPAPLLLALIATAIISVPSVGRARLLDSASSEERREANLWQELRDEE